MTRRQPMTLQLQQQWRKDGAHDDDSDASQTTIQANQPLTPAKPDDAPAS